MKKFLALFLVFGISAASMFSFSNYLGFGVRLASAQTTESSSGAKLESTPAGLQLVYIGCFDCGFSMIGDLGLSFSGMKLYSTDGTKLDDEIGAFVNLRAGLGYGFIRNSKIYLGLFGTMGCDYYAYVSSWEATIGSNTYSMKNEAAVEFFTMGIEPVFVFTPVHSFSLYALCGFDVGLLGEITSEVKRNGLKISSTNESLKNQFIWYPTIGICWKF